VHPGSLSLYVHYGQSRPKDAKSLAQCDVVITTYGILASEFSSEVVANLFTLIVFHLFASFLKFYQLRHLFMFLMFRMQRIMVDSSPFVGSEWFLTRHIL
jgi:SNF2 family DNA or RNA helicase